MDSLFLRIWKPDKFCCFPIFPHRLLLPGDSVWLKGKSSTVLNVFQCWGENSLKSFLGNFSPVRALENSLCSSLGVSIRIRDTWCATKIRSGLYHFDPHHLITPKVWPWIWERAWELCLNNIWHAPLKTQAALPQNRNTSVKGADLTTTPSFHWSCQYINPFLRILLR